ncbi:hypothetical protein L841_3333 [Mycobacterium sp. MAC_080597_8934]|nr:hypothetical protein L839_1614 [Mycobacterium avium MAV_120809_2495]ETZ66411.1 hypothetical protein L841_3333 [Mycobacterium sp. MAC_080597_8934]
MLPAATVRSPGRAGRSPAEAAAGLVRVTRLQGNEPVGAGECLPSP